MLEQADLFDDPLRLLLQNDSSPSVAQIYDWVKIRRWIEPVPTVTLSEETSAS